MWNKFIILEVVTIIRPYLILLLFKTSFSMYKTISLLVIALFGFSPIFSQSGKIIVNKKPRTNTTPTQTNKPTNPYPNNTKTNTPNTQNRQQRVKHANNQTLEHLELGYTISELGQTAKHNHYRISGHIYSKLNEPIFCHNRRIVMFQIDNWDSGFLNDNLQSIDGYATQYKLNNQGVLSVFGNSTVREFAFDFKVKKGLQPRVRSEIIKDWAPLSAYEQYLLLEYTMLNGSWAMEQNQEAKFDIQFAPQGNQLMMKDIFGTPVLWTKAEGNTYVRKIGNVPTQTQAQTQQQQQPSQNSNSSSNYPSGGYLGNGNNNQNQSQNQQNRNQQGSNQNKPSNYPSGGYLGNGNGNSQNNSQTNNTGTSNATGAYSSVIEIVDRNTIRYRNSEGIVCTLKKSTK